MSSLPQDSSTALAPVRRALREAAEQQAAALRDDADRQAGALLAAARARAEEIVTAAALEGAAAARNETALRSSRVRRDAQELVLARRSAVLADLRRKLASRASALHEDPRYPALVKGLTAECLELLGPGAVVSPSPEGGVVAVAGTRRLNLSLPELASLTLESLPEARELWSR